MLYYLDTNIVIYAVEGQAVFQQRARNHIAALETAGHRFMISELTWTECLVWPHRTGNGPLLLDYQRFFVGPHLTALSLSASAFHRAATIRGTHNFSLADSLHLATAVEHRIERFLTNDNRLAAFPGIPVEILP